MSVLNPYVLILIPIILIFINKKNLFFSLSAIFLILGLSEISKVETKNVKIANNDIFLVIDTTYSMLCNDLKPNRLEYLKKETIKFINKINFPVGIVVFNNNVKILSLPTTNKNELIKKIKSLKALKSRTDIQMAINKIKAINPHSRIIVLSDGGESKIKDDFIFWGFATKNGAKIPGFDAVSKLNIIGKKYFRYDEIDKLIEYLDKNKNYFNKEIKIYKPISFIFVVISFILFVIGIVVNRFNILMVLLFLYPNTIKANDLLGCIYEYVGFKEKAFSEFKRGKREFAKIKTAIYYIKKYEFEKALIALNNTTSKKAKYLKALLLAKLKKYNQAYKIAKTFNDEEGVKLFNFVKKYKKEKATISPRKDNFKHKNIEIKKEHLW